MSRRREKQQLEFVENLKKEDGKIRPDDFDGAWGVGGCVSGLYDGEMAGAWNALHGDLSDNIKSMVEVGRCWSGTLYMYCCLFRNLEKITSLELDDYTVTDPAIKEWLDGQNIAHDFVTGDSTAYIPDPSKFYDFVFIDGNHDGEYVTKDIAIWKDRCSYIGFHDFANRRGKNKHRRFYPGLVKTICNSWEENEWVPIGHRYRSEIIFKTGLVNPNNIELNELDVSARIELATDKLSDNLVGRTTFAEDTEAGKEVEEVDAKVVAIGNVETADIQEDAIDDDSENAAPSDEGEDGEDDEDDNQKEIDEETAEEDAERKAPPPEWSKEELLLLEKNPYA